MTLFDVTDLAVTLHTGNRARGRRAVRAVERISFSVEPGQTAAIVGESGSGKSVSLLAATRLLGPQAEVTGSVRFAGHDLLGLREKVLRRILGKDIGFVFQDPQSNLHPFKTIGHQIDEVLRIHTRTGRGQRRRRVEELLDEVGIADPSGAFSSYPAEFSGGMRQRAMIAMAIALNPALLIADEPTTALDVSVQADILSLLKRLQREHGTAILFVSHDLGVVHEIADTVTVVKDGRVVESGPRERIYEQPQEQYTRDLLSASLLHTVDTGHLARAVEPAGSAEPCCPCVACARVIPPGADGSAGPWWMRSTSPSGPLRSSAWSVNRVPVSRRSGGSSPGCSMPIPVRSRCPERVSRPGSATAYRPCPRCAP